VDRSTGPARNSFAWFIGFSFQGPRGFRLPQGPPKGRSERGQRGLPKGALKLIAPPGRVNSVFQLSVDFSGPGLFGGSQEVERLRLPSVGEPVRAAQCGPASGCTEQPAWAIRTSSSVLVVRPLSVAGRRSAEMVGGRRKTGGAWRHFHPRAERRWDAASYWPVSEFPRGCERASPVRAGPLARLRTRPLRPVGTGRASSSRGALYGTARRIRQVFFDQFSRTCLVAGLSKLVLRRRAACRHPAWHARPALGNGARRRRWVRHASSSRYQRPRGSRTRFPS
jgi:hypothetical protein